MKTTTPSEEFNVSGSKAIPRGYYAKKSEKEVWISQEDFQALKKAQGKFPTKNLITFLATLKKLEKVYIVYCDESLTQSFADKDQALEHMNQLYKANPMVKPWIEEHNLEIQ